MPRVRRAELGDGERALAVANGKPLDVGYDDALGLLAEVGAPLEASPRGRALSIG